MKSISWLLFLVVLCGCSQGKGETASIAGVAPEAGAGGGAAEAAVPAADRSFAALADRGELVAYSAPVRRSGAYTWHAARLSEAHAINSIVTGQMTLSAPDGTPISLSYDHHLEHADGNWTWVGNTADGEQALITFGPAAAFGAVPQGRGQAPLRLTTADGTLWVVATDSGRVAALDGAATDPREPDYLVPPKLSAGVVSRAGIRAAAAPTAGVTAASTAQVDVLVGYTQGFAAALGGHSAAGTRIQNLVDITNQAYANSRVDARIRLVHAMAVSYPDATDNGTALEELTGFVAPSTRTEPNPAFSALRNAREQHGADLVTLVRKFQTPENSGCGIAWLIGGGLSGISPRDEFFGYSVVSDGHDTGSDGTYYCRDETFAHELGHNMGSQHDAATANDEPGLYEYSFGYKTVAGGDFYTVMAYGDSGQHPYRVFSNPRITFCGGQACGVGGRADNARSLTAAIPVVSGFRASKASVATAFDFDGNGRSDLFWRNANTGQNSLWPTADAALKRVLRRVARPWLVAGVGDFNGDGRADILWRNATTGANTLWRSGNPNARQQLANVSGRGWQVGPIADFTGDGHDDILWINPGTGQGSIWPSATRSARQSVATIRDTAWKVVAGADFTGDGRADILLRHSRTGANLLWPSARSAQWRLLARVAHPEWKVAATGDFNGDGAADILWHRDATGQSSIWPSADRARRQSVGTLSSPAWRLGAVGDYNGDGRSDVVWRNRSSGGNVVWLSAQSGESHTLPTVAPGGWSPVHF